MKNEKITIEEWVKNLEEYTIDQSFSAISSVWLEKNKNMIIDSENVDVLEIALEKFYDMFGEEFANYMEELTSNFVGAARSQYPNKKVSV
ncbi:hypothetical protein [Candidatus Uabimicrobium sp. HlEnr_7]|uniref:hypothetical protein n=1 Tax=Candidatus Uabimicrobium helgolandensis TaxID=3095367 RepID=UPI003558D7D7